VVPKFKGQFDFLFVSNQQAANGIIRALKDNGIAPGKDVYIVSGDCSGSLEAVKNGETFGTGIQPAAVEGALAVRSAAKYIANGKIEGDVIQLEVTPEAPPIDNSPPAKYNYMPHAPAIGSEGVAKTLIWGYNADEICASG
jgi:ABC-type sugar transport system substrate-binding protein